MELFLTSFGTFGVEGERYCGIDERLFVFIFGVIDEILLAHHEGERGAERVA